MITHKKIIKYLSIALVALATFIGVAVSGVVVADEFKSETYAKHEAACFIFGKAAGLDDMRVHSNRVIAAEVEEGIITYVLGYHTGALDVFGTINANYYGSYALARNAAAVDMYKQFSCTVLESI
ncbi:MAG: hypothetical protein V3T88_00155 [Nitrosomonadaceae bacterium]